MISWLRNISVLALVAIAVVVPLRAFAGPGALSVSASLDHCGVSGADVVCQINASFNHVGADYYSAAVTLPNGTTINHGNVSPGGSALWVSYVGPGLYRVQVTAWGYNDAGKPEVIDKDGSGGQIGDDPNGKPAKIFSGKPTGPKPIVGKPTGKQAEPAAEEAPSSDLTPVTEAPPEPEPAPEPEPEPEPESVSLPPCEAMAASSSDAAADPAPPAPRECATPAQSPTGPCCP